MSFLAPDRLWLLVVPLLAIVAYAIALRRRQRYAVRFSDVALLEKVVPDRPGWRRHFTAAAAVLAITLLVVAVARPVLAFRVPQERATILLAVDVSLSMEADDVDPTRIEAAKEAAAAFVDLAPEELRIGVVAFSGIAVPALTPTIDRAAAGAAIAGLRLGEGTAIGEAIFAALDLVERERDEAGDVVPATIVVLSDGETTTGRTEAEAADAAASAGVQVSTIAFGTLDGSIEYEGETVPVPANVGALREVAAATSGRFSTAVSADEVQQILDSAGTDIGYETEEREVWEWFIVAGIAALGVAVVTSLVWFARMP